MCVSKIENYEAIRFRDCFFFIVSGIDDKN